jgi:hypothetical protein
MLFLSSIVATYEVIRTGCEYILCGTCLTDKPQHGGADRADVIDARA